MKKLINFMLFLSTIFYLNYSLAQNTSSKNTWQYWCFLEENHISEIAQELAQTNDAYNLGLAFVLAQNIREVNPNFLIDKNIINNWQQQALSSAKDPLSVEFLTLIFTDEMQAKAAKLWHKLEPQNLAPIFYLPKFENIENFLTYTSNVTYFKSHSYGFKHHTYQRLLKYIERYKSVSECLGSAEQITAVHTMEIDIRLPINGHNMHFFTQQCHKDNSDLRCNKIANLVLSNPQSAVDEIMALSVVKNLSVNEAKKAQLQEQINKIKNDIDTVARYGSDDFERSMLNYLHALTNPNINSEQDFIRFIVAQKEKFAL